MRGKLLPILLVIIGTAFFPQNGMSCPFDEPMGNTTLEEHSEGEPALMLSLEVEDQKGPISHTSAQDCCCMCKVYSMQSTAFHPNFHVPFVNLQIRLFQAKSIRNSNSGSWHPPKA